MKTLTVFLVVALIVSARGYLIKVPTKPVLQPTIGNFAPVGWTNMQKLILPLFENVCEPSELPTIVKLSQDFKLDTTNTDYSSPDVIKNLVDLKSSKGFLPKNKIFTEYNIDYQNELKVIYEVFYYANGFNAFYKAACWARQNINCGLFVDALYSAIIKRKDTEKLFIPAPYEILPNYFVRKDYIIQASSLITDDEITITNSIRNDGTSYILDVNYTTQVYDNTDESKLVYFYEDIGLNSYYYFTKLKVSPWVNPSDKHKYGEYLYYVIKQLMARYNLERYSNGLPEIEGIDWDILSTLPYYNPMLIYSDGNDFSCRTLSNVEKNERFSLLKNIENNVATIVTHMREGGFKKSDVLNHLMEILITSDRSYENLALQILNNDTTVNNRPPSVLEHYMTTIRDPAFWALNKKMVDIVDNALKGLPGYTRDELYFPGVEVLNVEVKKMMTSFDSFILDVTDALKTGGDDTKFKVKISQSRLNHKPFSIKVNITSLVSQKGLLRIFLGPKIMPGEHTLKKNLFMLLDSFEINLKYGSNIITRKSSDISDYSDDLLSLYTINKKISDAEFGLDSTAKLKSIDEQIRFPSRLMIPKGLTEGLPLQLFIFVVPFSNTIGGRLISTQSNKDALLSPGFPLDLDVEVQQLFDLPNALVKDILVTHKESTDYQPSNYGGRPGVKSWQDSDYQTPSEPVALPLAAGPDFTMRKEPFDYKSKRGQYGKNENFAVKKGDYKYRKDYTKVVDRPFASKNDKYVTNIDHTTTKQVSDYIPDDITHISKENSVYVITTDRYFDGDNMFTMDKKIQDTGNNEKVFIDITGNEKTDSYKTPTHFDETFHKFVIRNESTGLFDETIPSKTTEDSDEVTWNKGNKHIFIDITNDDKKLLEMKLEDSDEKGDEKLKDDINEDYDISNQPQTIKNIIYDGIFYPFYNGFEDKLYE